MPFFKGNTEELSDILSPSLIAGARHDEKRYVREAIRLANNQDIKIRNQAIFALGKIPYSSRDTTMTDAIHAINVTVDNETDDILLGTSIKASFGIYQQNNKLEDKVIIIISDALSKGGDNTLHAASEILSFYLDKVPESLLEVLIKHLANINPEHRGTLDNIDLGLEKLMARENAEVGVNFLEKLLTSDNGTIDLKALDGTMTWPSFLIHPS